MCDPMFQTFRETGVFVGNDAKYCLYDHPDAGLRGGLELQPVLIDGQIGHKMGFLMLIHHCLYRGLGMEDAYNKEMQIIFAIKMSFSRADLCLISESIFERLGCTKACFISEALLAADAYQAMYSPLKDFDQCPMEAKSLSLELYSSTSGMVVDIGARSTTVCPMYDGIIIPNAVQSCSVGGEHCTDFMELLLGAQHSEMFSSLLPRRKKLISRHIKEQYAFVAPSFVDAVEEYGSFRFDRVRLPRYYINLRLLPLVSCNTPLTIIPFLSHISTCTSILYYTFSSIPILVRIIHSLVHVSAEILCLSRHQDQRVPIEVGMVKIQSITTVRGMAMTLSMVVGVVGVVIMVIGWRLTNRTMVGLKRMTEAVVLVFNSVRPRHIDSVLILPIIIIEPMNMLL